jgi:hypothetical protein
MTGGNAGDLRLRHRRHRFRPALLHRHERHRRARHHRGRQHPVPFFGLHQRDKVGVGAKRLGAGFDGGGFGFAGDLDVGGPGFAVQPRGVGVGLRLGSCTLSTMIIGSYFSVSVMAIGRRRQPIL